MGELNLPVVDKTIHKTRLWLDEVMTVIETTDRARAYRALRAMLHALRDNLSVDATARFGAQMPLLIRGLYYEGWQPASPPDETVDEFVARVAEHFGDLPTLELEFVCRGVYRVIGAFVSDGEMRELGADLPRSVADFLASPRYRAVGETVISAP